MKVYCDDKVIKLVVFVIYEGVNSVYCKKGGELLYIEGLCIFDIFWYGKNDFKLFFEFIFMDRYNYKWKVVIDKEDDIINMFILCGI